MSDRLRRPFDRFRTPLERGTIEILIEEADAALARGDPGRALRVARRAVRAAEVARLGSLLAAALVVRAAAHQEVEDIRAALRDCERAVEVDRGSAAAWSELAGVRHRLGEPAAAVAACERGLQLEPDDARIWEQMGRALQWIDMERADAAFEQAARLAPTHFVRPVRVAAAEFDHMAQRAWEAMPRGLAAMLANVIAVVEPLPGIDDVREGLDPDVLGLYEGATALHGDGTPERILLFQHNLESISGTRAQLTEEVRRTVVHEVGHHLGMDHDELPF